MLGFQKNRAMRIDHILVNNAMRPLTTSCAIGSVPRKNKPPNEHPPVIAMLDCQK